jgi:DNA excision repair protein ERCC-3
MCQLLEQHAAGRVLVIGEYIAQVEAIAMEIGAPLVTGKTLQASGDSQRREVAINDLRRHVKTCRGKYGENRPEFSYLMAPWYSLHYSTKL